MTRSVFPYPGGKFYHADWVLRHLPGHESYVEPFGGGGAILLNKERSQKEVYNDADGDLVQFFKTLRDSPNELVEWLEGTPYSRELWDEYATAFYNGERPADRVERAGRFFYLRFSQNSAKYEGKSGFLSPRTRSQSQTYANAVGKLTTYAGRFQGVCIEHRDFTTLFDHYDTEETLFYCDPPYFGSEGRYLHDEFSHVEFADAVEGLDGRWLISYSELPAAIESLARTDDVSVRSYAGRGVSMGMNEGEQKAQPERLVMNFDPDETPLFSGPEQSTLPGATTDGGGQ